MTVHATRFKEPFAQSENGSRRPLVSRGVRGLERLLERVERSKLLDRAGNIIGTAFVKVVRPGPFKEFISGSWLAHPVHPMLTDIPIGAWTGAFVFDLRGDEASHRAADALIGVGVLTALPTAVTGLSDLADVTESDQRTVGTAHMFGNVGAVILYGASYLARRRGARGAGLVLSTLGATAATLGGFLGGHLAYRKGIGVDQTAFLPDIGDWKAAMPAADLSDKPRCVSVDGVDLLLVRTTDGVRALANRCSHRGGPLHEGDIHDGTVVCPWHQSAFDLTDGSVVRGPATAPQPTFDVRTKNGTIEVRSARR
jgi:nitrite reductase/ring-hydroxylating ferredoxin subunit/uncharacterized membrane protein